MLLVLTAEMSTVINSPHGVVESSGLYPSKGATPAHVMEKRKKMKGALIQRFAQQHGNDSVRLALITKEVESNKALMAGTLTADGLASLEKAVAKAVSAAVPKGPPQSTGLPKRGDPKTDFAVTMKEVADWTKVAHHRANYYLVEQQRKANAYQMRKDDLHEQLSHQIQQVDHEKRLRRHQEETEAKEMQKKLDEFEAEKRAVVEKKKAKVKGEMAVRAEQMAELKARRAAAERLQKLEVTHGPQRSQSSPVPTQSFPIYSPLTPPLVPVARHLFLAPLHYPQITHAAPQPRPSTPRGLRMKS